MSQIASQQQSQFQDQSNETINSSIIRANIALNNVQLRQLSSNDDKFFQTIQQINDNAVHKILNNHPKEALIYLSEAERVLQYGACCGKIIDRNLIICVLHNMAAGYQRIWVIDRCSKYLQAVIYNIELSLNSESNFVLIQQLLASQNLKSKEFQILSSIMKKKMYLMQYYLQYCAIISQQKNHELALTSSTKAVFLIKQIIQISYKFYKKNFHKQKQEMETATRKLKTLKQLSQYKWQIQLENYQHLLQRVKYVHKQWNENQNQQKQQQIKQWLKNYSIGNVMQMEPSTYKNYDQIKDFMNEVSLESITKKILLFSISYFTIATEIRLIQSEKYFTDQQRKSSIDFQKSQLYHLTAIKIFCTYIPYQSMFITHVLNSYNNHYMQNLIEDQISYIADDQLIEKQQKQSDNQKNSFEKSLEGRQMQEKNLENLEKLLQDQRCSFQDKVEYDQQNQNHIKPLIHDITQNRKLKKKSKEKFPGKLTTEFKRPQTCKTNITKGKIKLKLPTSPRNNNNTSKLLNGKINLSKQKLNPNTKKEKLIQNNNSKQKIKQNNSKQKIKQKKNLCTISTKTDVKKILIKPLQRKRQITKHNTDQSKSQQRTLRKKSKKEINFKTENQYFVIKKKQSIKQKKK